MIDIDSRKNGVAGRLSNFEPRLFWFDGVVCACVEGPLQAFKFRNPRDQKMRCSLSGKAAKIQGQERNKIWQSHQTLWWKGMSYSRESQAYQELLNKLFRAVASTPEFQDDLSVTGEKKLIHTIGETDPMKTVLTIDEFCSRLEKLREILENRRIMGIEGYYDFP